MPSISRCRGVKRGSELLLDIFARVIDSSDLRCTAAEGSSYKGAMFLACLGALDREIARGR